MFVRNVAFAKVGNIFGIKKYSPHIISFSALYSDEEAEKWTAQLLYEIKYEQRKEQNMASTLIRNIGCQALQIGLAKIFHQA